MEPHTIGSYGTREHRALLAALHSTQERRPRRFALGAVALGLLALEAWAMLPRDVPAVAPALVDEEPVNAFAPPTRAVV